MSNLHLDIIAYKLYWAESGAFSCAYYIFRIKLCNFTHFNMLFLVVVMDFVLVPISKFSL
jgi:hypothetical protein